MINKSGMLNKKKVGIAFSGGGCKGYVYLGVIKALEENGIKFDYVAGTSVGSIFGALYAAGHSFEQMCEIAKQLDFKDLKTTKFFPSQTDKLQKIITDNLGNINIEDLKTPFCAVATDLKTLSEVALSTGNLAKAVAGSSAVPGLFIPVRLEDKILCDGGLKNSMPADVLKMNGCDYVISISLDGGSKESGIKTTKVLDVLICALQILINDTSYKGQIYSDLIITPDVSKFSFMKRNDLQEMIEVGYNATIEAMPQILKIFEYSKKNKILNKIDCLRKVTEVPICDSGEVAELIR